MADYGHAHRKLRQRWARLVAEGDVACARCGQRIWPGQHWDLGHRDDDSGEYQGPEHRRCNRTAGGWKRWHPNGATTVKPGKPLAPFSTHRRWGSHDGGAQGAMNYLVCGPPCAGKSTWVEENASADALVVCFDTIARTLGHRGPGRPPFKVGRAAEAEVQRLLATIERDRTAGAYVIRTMAGADRRAELASRIHAEVVLLTPDLDELARRASQRPDPSTTMRDIAKWFDRERQGATQSRWTH